MCNDTTQDHGDEARSGFQIIQRSLDGGRPRGQLTFDGTIAPTQREQDQGGDSDCD